jgi:hypothetical protein
LQRLEPYAVKVARTVLRGGGDGNVASLPDRFLALPTEAQDLNTLRIIGDVHGQIEPNDLPPGESYLPYLGIIAGAPCSIQVGDMGNGDTYDRLVPNTDASRHRFFPGNHDNYDRLPKHSLGDFGAVCLGGVDFFFVRGAASIDKALLVRRGRELGRTLWFEQEELSEEQMRSAEREYLCVRPKIMLSHDAPTDIGQSAWQHARQFSPPNPGARFQPSRTNAFLARLLEQHSPRLWVFGHHHRDWTYRESNTLFVCVGVLSYIDIDSAGEVRRP